MERHPLAGLEPACVFRFFEEICAIPHGSRDTKAISDYLVRFAQQRSLRWLQDESNNVILFAAGTPGYEDHAPVILQGHMDMVCEKDPESTIDFSKDGLDLTHDQKDLFARGTTLGGDDGIAVAYALALLDAKDLPHPPLEVILTVDEEIGMLGAAAIDVSMLRGRTLINLDSEDEGVLTVSCAGGATSTILLPVTRRTVYGPCVCLTVQGLQGGHSGVEIHKNRANANKVMGMLLSRMQESMPVCLTNLSGGAKDNAIPRTCRASLVIMDPDLNLIAEIAQSVEAEAQTAFDDPALAISVEQAEALGGMALSPEDTKRVIDLLQAVPNGVQAMSQDIAGLVQTSLNLGIAQLEENLLRLTFSVRSSVNEEKQALLDRLRKLAEQFGGTYEQMGEYPAWEYRKDSPLRELMVQVYQELFHAAPQVVAIHAGLECGILGDKLPGLDCVSFGPQMQDIHTSRERLNIASTARMWEYLLEILRRL